MSLVLYLQVGALTRLCDVLRVLREEQDQCLQELSRDGKGGLGLEPLAPGMRFSQLIRTYLCPVPLGQDGM